MDDGNKIAAALLAVEASRQKQSGKTPTELGQAYDIAGEIMGYYHHFVLQLMKAETRQKG